MGVQSGQTRVADLNFQVYGRALHPEWFSIRTHRRYVQAGWEVDIRIVEGGHVIIWNCGPVRLSEVLIGAEIVLPHSGLLFESTVRQERSTCLRPADHVEYQSCFSAERIDDGVFAHLSDELTLVPARRGLLHRYPPTNRLAPAPLSRIDVEPHARGVSIQTFHTFPDERAIVRTQSLFELRPPRP